MLLKWIICRVPEANRAAFAEAQRAWSALADVDGFRGQCGGWDIETSTDACILALWANRGAYDAFIRNVHDAITGPSGQDALYDSINVELFELMFEIPGSAANWSDAFVTAQVLRTADCDVHPRRVAHCVQMQQEVWNPGMANHDAMRGGLFSRAASNPLRLLVYTWWRDREGHDRYDREAEPALKKAAAVELDCRAVTGRVIILDPNWRVRPER